MAPSQASPAPSQSSAISPGKINVQGHLGVCCLGHPGTVPRTCPGSRWLAGAWDWLPRLRGGSWHRRRLTWTMSLLVAWGNSPVEGKAGAGAVFRHLKNMGDGARQASGVGRCCRAVGGDRHVRLSASPREPLRRLTGGPPASTSAQAGTWPSEPRSSRGPPDKGPGCPGVGGVLRVGASRVLPCSRCALVPPSLQRWPSAPPRQGRGLSRALPSGAARPAGPGRCVWRCPHPPPPGRPTGRPWALCRV